MTLWNELIDAYLDNDMEHRYFLDLQQGIVVMDWDESVTGEPGIDWDDPQSMDRYSAVPQCTTPEAYSWRERFAADDATGQLADALHRNRPFRRFKDALADLRLWDAWNVYEREWAERVLKDWVEQLPLAYDVLQARCEAYWKNATPP